MFSSNHHNSAFLARRTQLAAIAALAPAALILGGCGGSSSPSTSTPNHQSSAARQTQSAAGGRTRSGTSGSESASATSATEKQPVRVAGGPGRHAGRSTAVGTREPNLAVPKGPNPCVLVSSAEAQAILGAPIAGVTEAPLGPTCIFKLKGRQQTVTLAVEPPVASTQIKEMRKPQRVTVGGHTAYCGTLGRPMLDVTLAGGKILNVTAPCTVAEALAAKALSRTTA